MTPEGKVKAKVKAVLKKHGVFYFMPRGSIFGKAGVADIVACYMGKFVAIETKAGRNKLTMRQELVKQDIEQAGGVYFVIREDNVGSLEEWLNNVEGSRQAVDFG